MPIDATHATAARERRLGRFFVELADTLVADFDLAELMQRLVDYSADMFGVAHAALLLTDQRVGVRLVASTTENARLLEVLQLQIHEGPCVDCVRTGRPVLVPDLTAAASRWPRFAHAAGAQGIRSSHTVPLRLRDQVIGALGLFGATAGPLADSDMAAAQAVADIAAIGILQQRAISRTEVLAEQLQTALDSRVVIEQAKGVLAATGGLDMDSAYQLLRAYCRAHNLPLTATAARIARRTLTLADILEARTGRGL